MNDAILLHNLRKDCIASLKLNEGLSGRLAGQHIAVVGGTGFVGTWLAEMISVLNDEFGARIRIDLLGRSATNWQRAHPHLASRPDIQAKSIDVRSPFALDPATTLVLFAAGIADPRIHASEPLRVFETAVNGIANTLAAATRLEALHRFVNLSSGLVVGAQQQAEGLSEEEVGLLDFTKTHNVYAESRRMAENLVGVYASQFRIPVTTARAFTFIGPYQPLNAPWAVNDFIRDALLGNDIRVHGDGATRRSYLYGSDAACWLLRVLVDGQDDEVYHIGGENPISHADVAEMVARATIPSPSVVYRSQLATSVRRHDFFPKVDKVQKCLGLKQAFDLQAAIERTMQWYAHHYGASHAVHQVKMKD